MKNELVDFIGRNIPLTMIGVLLLQGATAVWWVSARDRDNFFLEQRVTKLEIGLARNADGQTQALERLARIEERVSVQLGILDRIEKQLGSLKR